MISAQLLGYHQIQVTNYQNLEVFEIISKNSLILFFLKCELYSIKLNNSNVKFEYLKLKISQPKFNYKLMNNIKV